MYLNIFWMNQSYISLVEDLVGAEGVVLLSLVRLTYLKECSNVKR